MRFICALTTRRFWIPSKLLPALDYDAHDNVVGVEMLHLSRRGHPVDIDKLVFETLRANRPEEMVVREGPLLLEKRILDRPMNEDPIVAEVRRIREQRARRFDYEFTNRRRPDGAQGRGRPIASDSGGCRGNGRER